MSIPILRSYSIELLIRLLNLINLPLPNTIFIMRRLNTIALILPLFDPHLISERFDGLR